MPIRLLHTADWHLGHTLRGQSRQEEHRRFLDWLLDVLVSHRPDALLVAGDVFDSANPPTTAIKAYFEFLTEARHRRPDLDIVVVAGNHDSAPRIDAPHSLLDALGVHVVGDVPRLSDGSLDAGRLIVPLYDSEGVRAAQLVAMPFLRPADLPRVAATEGDPLIQGVQQLYAEALAAVEEAEGCAIVAIGHCFMAGARLSERSERKVLGGNQHALPVSIFPASVTYVALGHLHLPQAVDDAGRVRYSGSPLPLSMTEAGYPHQVLLVSIDGATLRGVEPLLVPRTVDLLRLPEGGARPLDDVLELLAALPDRVPEEPLWLRPFLEVSVRVDGPQPDLRAKVEAAVQGKRPRLVSIKVERAEVTAAPPPVVSLEELSPEAVFRRRWARDYEGDPPPRLLAAFHELVDAVEGDGARRP